MFNERVHLSRHNSGAIMSDTNPVSLLSDLIDRARRAGADAADAVFSEGISMSLAQRLGAPEKVERSEGQDLGLRVFVGKRQAIVSSTDFAARALGELVERAVSMARLAPEDPYLGLAEPADLTRDFPDLDTVDDVEPSTETLVARAKLAEEAALAVPGVTNSAGAETGWSRSRVVLATSNGFAGEHQVTRHGLSTVVLAGEGTAMERDYEFSSAVHGADLLDPELLGTRAGAKAVARLNPRKVPTQKVPIVFDRRVAALLVRSLAGAISGPAIARGTSFLKDHIIEGGVLQTWLLDLRSGRQLGLPSTGHASRGTSSPPSPSPSNLYLEAGAVTPEELISDIASGFYVTDLMGSGVNGVTGDYSQGAAGFWIEGGEIAYPVSEVTIAGNLKQMYLNMFPANDLEFRAGVDAPTVRVEGLTLAGSS
jgi:PmbA protein